jgi:putative FmdB family regulatory protein
MPIYEFHCPKCHKFFEVITIRAEWSKIRCHKCKGKVKKVMTPANFTVKGANAQNSYGLKKGDDHGKD